MIMRKRAKLLASTVTAAALVFAAAPKPAGAAKVGDTVRFTGQCAMDSWAYAFQIRSTFRPTFVGVVVPGNKALIHRIEYQFGMAELWYLGQVFYGYFERDNQSNINVTYPVSRRSADNLAPVGSWNNSDFTISNGSRISAQGVLDVVNQPDPSCTASVTAGWSTK